MKFSERLGYKSTDIPFEREFISQATRTKLWNLLKLTVWDVYDSSSQTHQQRHAPFFITLWFDHLGWDLDEMPGIRYYSTYDRYVAEVKRYFSECEWYEVYDLLQFASDNFTGFSDSTRSDFNFALEAHNCAYRFVDTEIIEVTDEQEIEAIQSALADADHLVREHLDAALRMLSDREAADYRNSVKESISAVEAACRIATNQPSSTLNKALQKIENVHPALVQAFEKLYAYAGDASGIRHAMKNDAHSVTYAEAKFMLVACSGFVSYLKLSVQA